LCLLKPLPNSQWLYYKKVPIETGLIAFLVFFLVVVTTAVYFVLMIFFPEWVGITGRSAKATLDEHKEGAAKPPEKDFFKDH
jgi:hypothetical protein